ncbi:hypothetical protein WJX82_000054 [Trebouxia sp. C0006]
MQHTANPGHRCTMALNGTPLGNELLSIIFAFLPARDLAKAEVTCVCWHQVIEQYALWKVKTAKTWEGRLPLGQAIPAEASGYTSQQWKSLYWRHLAAWRVQEPRNTVIKFLEGHKQPVTCLAALSHTFASGSEDRGPKSLRHIVSSDQQHICATAILDNQLFIASVGSNCVQVWDSFSGSLQMMFRPASGPQITALATGTVHATQVLLVGTYDCQILALSPTDGSVIAIIDGLRTPDEAVEEVGQARLLNLVHLQNIQSVVARRSWRATMNNRIQEPACGLQSPEVYISSSSVAMHVHE